MEEKVELRPAYAWDCPDCGREHFARAIVQDMPEDEKAHLKEEMGISPDEDGHFEMAPSQVRCDHCDKEFDTQLAFGYGYEEIE